MNDDVLRSAVEALPSAQPDAAFAARVLAVASVTRQSPGARFHTSRLWPEVLGGVLGFSLGAALIAFGISTLSAQLDELAVTTGSGAIGAVALDPFGASALLIGAPETRSN